MHLPSDLTDFSSWLASDLADLRGQLKRWVTRLDEARVSKVVPDELCHRYEDAILHLGDLAEAPEACDDCHAIAVVVSPDGDEAFCATHAAAYEADPCRRCHGFVRTDEAQYADTDGPYHAGCFGPDEGESHD